MYTDASFGGPNDSGGLGSIVTDRDNFANSNYRVDTISESIAPSTWIDCFRHSSIIFGLELAAV